RTLSTTLQVAQQARGAVPAVRLTRRRASAGEDRYTLSFVAGASSASDPYAVSAWGGVLRLWSIHSGSVRVDYCQGNPLAYASGGTRWSTGDTLIAAAQQQSAPANFAVVTATPLAGSLALRFSSAGDAAFGAAETLILPNGLGYEVQTIACCFAPDGRVFVAVQGLQYITVFVRATNATYTSFSNVTDAHYAARGIGCCYTTFSGAGDLAIYASGGYAPGTRSELVGLLFGDGALQPAGTFSRHQTVLITQPYVTGTGAAPAQSTAFRCRSGCRASRSPVRAARAMRRCRRTMAGRCWRRGGRGGSTPGCRARARSCRSCNGSWRGPAWTSRHQAHPRCWRRAAPPSRCTRR
ncbi:MAG TPA: hypothetical protein VH916_01945, partial [Dehalococcoidia bacterium]